MDNQQMYDFGFNAMSKLKSNGMPVIDIPQKTSFESISRPCVHFASDVNINNGGSSKNAVQFDDQPSWLDDLLDEPESPLNKSVHRRSRSDSVTYLDTDCRTKEDLWYTDVTPLPTLDFQKSSYYKELLQNSAHGKQTSLDVQQQGPWNSPFGPSTLANTIGDDIVSKISGISLSQQEQNAAFPIAGESTSQYTKNSDAATETCQNQSSAGFASKAADAKRVKQHNARRSRVRKVQYIGELERSIQVLQAEGSMASAEMEFLDQQNLILNMENRALKQHLEGLSQVQLIKSLEQEVLEREMARLQHLYHQQNICIQQQQQLSNHPMHRRVRSCNEFESQSANLGLKPKEKGSNSNSKQQQ